MLEERLNQISASINVQIRPFLLLNSGDFFGNISVQKHGRLPCVRSQGIRGDVFGNCVDGWPNLTMLRPECCPNVKGFPP